VPRLSYLGSALGHLAAYGLMVLLSYYWGQKFYRIQYQLGRIGFYFLLAVALFLAGYCVPVEENGLSLVINTILFLLFLVVIYFRERKEFKTVF
jgi:hypothetical protein